MKKLWTATVEVTMYVWAETAQDAQRVAEHNAGEEVGNGGAFVTANPTERLLYGWENAIPWGNDDNRDCATLLAESRHVGTAREESA